MKFIPKSEDDLVRESLLEPGEYPFRVIDAVDATSKNGNEMIKLKLEVFGKNGDTAHVFDYLLEKMAFKLRHFAESAGMLDKYERGEFSAMDCMEKQGYVSLDIEPASNGYSAKNAVKDYANKPLRDAAHKPHKPLNPAPGKKATDASLAEAGYGPGAQPLDDDIPF